MREVSGVERESAAAVSTHDGGAAYGGTPSDRSVMDAIAEIKARGLKVTLYPFVMMDVPAGNELPDPYGNPAQPAYPWRGRITANPAPLMPGAADRTAAARAQVEAFCGDALPGQFSASTNTIAFSGPSTDWGFRRFVLHHAKLAQAAGGVDAFLLGSELRGLTTLRDESDGFPFVEELCVLAGDVRAMLGPATRITYGADWSEYFGHHPQDGSGDVYFHLDPLWAHPGIDAVGIDNYMPLSDWRDADHAAGNPDGFAGPYDPAGLRAGISGGEGFDWHYPTFEARRLRERVAITDGGFEKPWVFRYKDLNSWWSNQHFDRIDGAEAAAPTAWIPASKPFFFTEIGCPATDKGPNQPNVFSDPKSAESMSPYFSSGGRSDVAQQRFLLAHHRHWDPEDEEFDAASNPASPLDGRRMVDPERLYVWAWDARPFPAFPLRSDYWSDHGNWHYGHWLNGRLCNPTAGELINAILADHGLPRAQVDGVDGIVHGYAIDQPGSARGALEPLTDLFGLAVLETPDGLAFRGEAAAGASIAIGEMASDGREPVIETVRTPDHQLPTEAVLSFRDPLVDHQAVSVSHSRNAAPGARQYAIGFPGVLEAGQGRALAGDWLARAWNGREHVSFRVPQPGEHVVTGALVRLPDRDGDWLVSETEDGLVRKVLARRVVRAAGMPWRSANPGAVSAAPMVVGQPLALFLDLPIGVDRGAAQDQFRIAAWQKPWKSQAVFASPESSGFTQRSTIGQPADLGVLTAALPPGVVGRIDRSATITVELYGGELASVSRALLLNGANSVAIRSAGGAWEIVQFETAEEIAPDTWRLSSLLRGQLGTDDAMAAGAAAGTHLVVLDEAVQTAGLSAGEAGLLLNWRVGPAGSDLSSEDFAEHSGVGGLRALLPLSPAHLRAARADGGDVALSWIRRGRIDADSWTASEIPLGEEREEYQVQIAHPGGAVVRTATTLAPGFLYESADILADFGAPPAEIDVTVRQLSLAAGWGFPATRRLSLS